MIVVFSTLEFWVLFVMIVISVFCANEKVKGEEPSLILRPSPFSLFTPSPGGGNGGQ